MAQPRPPLSVPEGVTRFLRHEVGDLLQTVYAGMAVLKERLPPDWTLERTILTNVRTRAERTREVLDLAHDLVVPMILSAEPINLSELLTTLASAAWRRHTQREFLTDVAPTPPFRGDLKRTSQLGALLLDYAAETARRTVRVQARPRSPAESNWVVISDGP